MQIRPPPTIHWPQLNADGYKAGALFIARRNRRLSRHAWSREDTVRLWRSDFTRRRSARACAKSGADLRVPRRRDATERPQDRDLLGLPCEGVPSAVRNCPTRSGRPIVLLYGYETDQGPQHLPHLAEAETQLEVARPARSPAMGAFFRS
jgi:hypothetical protein